MTHPEQQSIVQHIREFDAGFELQAAHAVGGGSINSAWRFEGQKRSYFVKFNRAERVGMFAAEADGLQALAAAQAVHVPRALGHGVAGAQAFLICEWLCLSTPHRDSAEILGRQLAELHGRPQTGYGWHRDNTIGSTAQPNTPDDDWSAFWREQRLGFQLALGRRHGFSSPLLDKGERLMDKLPKLLAGHQPAASLLHGDLWGGNWGVDASGAPVLFDPAVYCGDREADMAMTELFGGFPEAFYAAYRECWPLDEGYQLRRTLYNLYHVLNHANLFGGGYAAQAEAMVDRLLAEAG